MRTTIVVKEKGGKTREETIIDGKEDIAIIPVVGDRVGCFGTIGKIADRLIFYDTDAHDEVDHISVILEVEEEKLGTSPEDWVKLGKVPFSL